MKLLTLSLSGIILFSCGQKNKPQSDEFLELLNHYQADSLRNTLASNFQIKRTYTNYKTDLNSFLGEYMEKSKAFNGKYKVVKAISTTEPKIFLIEDQSDYLKYLDVNSPTWKIMINRNTNNKIEEVTFDTTETFGKYSLDIKSQEASFKKWLEIKYPNETLELLHDDNKLLFERLKTYSMKN